MCIHSPGGVCVYVKDRGDGVLETRLYMRRVSVASYRTYVLVAQNTLIVVVIIIISSCSSSSSSLGVFMCWWWCRSYHASCWEHYWLHETQSRARSQYVTKLLWWCLRHVRLRGRRRHHVLNLIRSFVYSFCYQTCVWTQRSEKQWTDFDANRHKWFPGKSTKINCGG